MKEIIICKHCLLAIEPIIDPWGFDSHRGNKYGYYHVAATDNDDFGKYHSFCVDGCTEAEPMLQPIIPPTDRLSAPRGFLVALTISVCLWTLMLMSIWYAVAK